MTGTVTRIGDAAIITQEEIDKWTINPESLFAENQKLKAQLSACIKIAKKLMVFGINGGCWIEALQKLEKEMQDDR